MEISKLFVQARSATVQIADGGLYHTKAVYQLFLNGQAAGTADTAVTSLYDLQPETEYVLSVRWGAEEVGRVERLVLGEERGQVVPLALPGWSQRAETVEHLDRAVQRDARRYDGGFSLY